MPTEFKRVKLAHLNRISLLLQAADDKTACKLGHLSQLISYADSVDELNQYTDWVNELTRTHRTLN